MRFTQELFSSKRLSSFTWRLGSVAVIAMLGYIQSHVTDLQLSESAVVILGLMLGEITKAINNAVKY